MVCLSLNGSSFLIPAIILDNLLIDVKVITTPVVIDIVLPIHVVLIIWYAVKGQPCALCNIHTFSWDRLNILGLQSCIMAGVLCHDTHR